MAGFLTGSAVVLFRVFLDSLHADSFQFQNSFSSHFPVFFYYLVFASFFYLFKIKNLYSRPFIIGLLGIVIEIIANLAEISIRHFTNQMQITSSALLIIGGVAIIRSFFVLGFFNILILRETRLAEEQQRKRNEQILIIISKFVCRNVSIGKVREKCGEVNE